MKARVLVVDDDVDLLNLIEIRLKAAGYEVSQAESGEAALTVFRSVRPQVVVTDLCMPGMDGMQLFECLQNEAPTVPVIVLTAHGTIPDAVDATQRGVFSFLTKPFDGRELVRRIDEAVRLSPALDPRSADGVWRDELLTANLRMEEVLRLARRIAEDAGATLIHGLQGTGKRLLAKAMHRVSRYAQGRFEEVECGNLSAEQINDFFAEGRFEHFLAGMAGGVLYISDVDMLPPLAQARLYTLLLAQNQARQPLQRLQHGGRNEQFPDVFVIPSSRGGIQGMVADGSFRSDLYYLMSGGLLEVPSLSERIDDIPLLAQALLQEVSASRYVLAPEAIVVLKEASWPGNISQLKNVLQQAAMQTAGSTIAASTIQRILRAIDEATMPTLDEARRGFEKNYLIRLLQVSGGNVSLAARMAQRNRTEFYKLLARYELNTADYKQKLP